MAFSVSEVRIVFRAIDQVGHEVNKVQGHLAQLAASTKALEGATNSVNEAQRAQLVTLKDISMAELLRTRNKREAIAAELDMAVATRQAISADMAAAAAAATPRNAKGQFRSSAEIKAAQKELHDLNLEMRAASEAVNKLEATDQGLGITMARQRLHLNNATAALNNYDNSLKRASVSSRIFNTATQGFGAIAPAIARGATLAASAIGVAGLAAEVSGIQFNMFLERTSASFGALLHDKEKANQFLTDLYAYTRTTALSFELAAEAAQEFRARGIETEQIIPILSAIVDAASALPRPIEDSVGRISYALGQIQQSAVLNAQDMRQLTEVGVNAWGYLAESVGMSVDEVKAKNTELGINSKSAFATIVAGMKREFGGMAQVQKETSAGQVATAKRTMRELTGIFAQPIFDDFKRELNEINKKMEDPKFRDSIKEMGVKAEEALKEVARILNDTIISGLLWIINNKDAIVASVIAIGAAFAWVHPVAAAMTAIVAGIGLYKSQNGGEGNFASQIANYISGKAGLPKTTSGTEPGGYLQGVARGDVGQAISDLIRIDSEQRNPLAGIGRDAVLDLTQQLIDTKRNNAPVDEWGIPLPVAPVEGAPPVEGPVPGTGPGGGGIPPVQFGGKDAEDAAKGAADAVDKLSEEIKSALSDGIITLSEALDLKLTPAMVAAYELTNDLSQEQIKNAEATYRLQVNANKLAIALNRADGSVVLVARNIAKLGMELTKTAFDAVSSMMTLERASMEKDLAGVNLAHAEAARQITPQIEGIEDQIRMLSRASREWSKQENEGDNPYDQQLEMLNDQMDDLNHQIELIDRQSGAIQRNIDVEQARLELKQAEFVVADATLMSSREQLLVLDELIANMRLESGIVAATTAALGGAEGLIPELAEARRSHAALTTLLDEQGNPRMTEFVGLIGGSLEPLEGFKQKLIDINNMKVTGPITGDPRQYGVGP